MFKHKIQYHSRLVTCMGSVMMKGERRRFWSEDTLSATWVHTNLVDKQSEDYKGTMATILLSTKQTCPFKMSNKKLLRGPCVLLTPECANHLTTMSNLCFSVVQIQRHEADRTHFVVWGLGAVKQMVERK